MNKRLKNDVALATAKAVCELFRWSDAAEFEEAVRLVAPVIASGFHALEEFSRREFLRLNPLKEGSNATPEDPSNN